MRANFFFFLLDNQTYCGGNKDNENIVALTIEKVYISFYKLSVE